MGNRAHRLALKGRIQYGVRSVLCYKYKQKTLQNPKSIVELILTQYILEECSPMCNVSGLHRHLQRLYLAGSTGKFTLHISDLWYSSQIWLAVKTQHLLASPTPAHHCNTNWGVFMKRLLYLVSLQEAFFGCHCLDVFIGEGYTGRFFSSSLSNQYFPFTMSAFFPISQPSFRPIKPQKPFV